MFHYDEQGGEAKAVGWISMADMFMLCSIVMLAVAVCFALSLKKTDQLLSSVESEYAQNRTVSSQTINELKAKVAFVSSEAGGLRSQTITLDQQLKNLHTQLNDTEKQLVFFKSESAKFKAQSEGLSSELTLQTSKFNALQSEFDKYRNSNTLAMGELKSESLRLTKELDTYKATVDSLRLQLSGLSGKLAESEKQVASLITERDKFKSESSRFATDLDKLKLRLETELATLNANLATAQGEFGKASKEKELLLSDLNTLKSSYVVLQKVDDDLKLKLKIALEDKKKVDAKLADLEGTIVGLTGELGELKPQLEKLKIDLTGANLRIIDLEKAVFEKINRARLVITVTAQDVPKDFTLELFVTDPDANVCGPFSSVIFNEGDEIGVLQQSVDFKSGREGSQKAVFYSLRPINSKPGRNYTVKAMIRHNGNDETMRLLQKVMVNCSIDLPNLAGPDAHKVARREIDAAGFIKKVKQSGPLTPNSQYKNMWPWEPVYHFERILCDFRIDGDKIADLRSYENLSAEPPSTVQNPAATPRDTQEQKIDSIRTRN